MAVVWSVVFIVVLAGAWYAQLTAGALSITALAVLSVGSLIFFLFVAESDCRAITRGRSYCRNNAHGLLGACHIQQHKRQKLRKLVPFRLGPSKLRVWWERNTVGLASSPRQLLDTAGTAFSILSAIAAAMMAGWEIWFRPDP